MKLVYKVTIEIGDDVYIPYVVGDSIEDCETIAVEAAIRQFPEEEHIEVTDDVLVAQICNDGEPVKDFSCKDCHFYNDHACWLRHMKINHPKKTYCEDPRRIKVEL